MARRVNLGDSGTTPQKRFVFERDAPPTSIPQATPTRRNPDIIKSVLNWNVDEESEDVEECPYSSPKSKDSEASAFGYSRPKTSRGKARPSPDEFADYVVRSPSSPINSKDFAPPRVLKFDQFGANKQLADEDVEESSVDTESNSAEFDDEEQMLGLLACWLVGCSLQL